MADDVRLIGKDAFGGSVTRAGFGGWLDEGHAQSRAQLRPRSKIGTGFQSIDDPFGDRAPARRRRA